MKTAVGYLRVSTGRQAKEGLSLDMQRAKIRQYCDLNDLKLLEIVEDAGISAKNITGRPGMQRALDMVYCGQADALVVYKLDRAFRSTRDALTVAETLNKKGRGLHSITEKLDTTSAIGEFFFTLMASLAQMERRQTGERVAAIIKGKKERGEKIGGDTPFGYTYQEVDRPGNSERSLKVLIEDPVEQEIIGRIQDLKTEGYSFRAIAKELNTDGYTTKAGTAWTHVQVSRIYGRAA